MPIIIYDEADLCIRNPSDGGDLCGRSVIYEGGLCGRNVFDVEVLDIANPVDEATFPNVNSARVDIKDLCTMIAGDGVVVAFYRADTTRIFADNTIMDCSYHK